MKVATDVMFTQMSANTDIKKFGEKAVASLVKQYKQINNKPMYRKQVVTPIDTDTMSYKAKRTELEEFKLRKEKKNGIIKGRTCADGSLK